MDFNKILPLGAKLLVELVPVSEGQKMLGLKSMFSLALCIDEKSRSHHWDHKIRVAKVLAVGARVRDIKRSDYVVFEGTAGRWVEPELGESSLYRSLEEKEVMGLIATEEAVA